MRQAMTGFRQQMLAGLLRLLAAAVPAGAQAPDAAQPWLDPGRPPDERADLALRALTLDEKIRLVHGSFGSPFQGRPKPEGAIGSAGYVPGVPRLKIPALQESDAGL